jgi:hypothetical protein
MQNSEWRHKGAVVFMETHCFECLFCPFVLEVVICLFRALLDCGQICMAIAASVGVRIGWKSVDTGARGSEWTSLLVYGTVTR